MMLVFRNKQNNHIFSWFKNLQSIYGDGDLGDVYDCFFHIKPILMGHTELRLGEGLSENGYIEVHCFIISEKSPESPYFEST